MICEGIQREIEDFQWLEEMRDKMDVTKEIEEIMRIQERLERQ